MQAARDFRYQFYLPPEGEDKTKLFFLLDISSCSLFLKLIPTPPKERAKCRATPPPSLHHGRGGNERNHCVTQTGVVTQNHEANLKREGKRQIVWKPQVFDYNI